MNIVKGVADLIRRSSGGQGGDGSSWGHAEKFSAPSARIRFSNVAEEAVVNTLWQKYENAIDKTEKRKSLQVFLLHFIQTYKNWEPVYKDQLPREQASPEDIVVGCFDGHPSEVILILIQEIARITSFVVELNISSSDLDHSAQVGLNCSSQSTPESSSQVSLDSTEPSVTDGLYVLDCMTIITRSMHNCKVFSYYGGVQKVSSLLKAAVVQLKTLTSALAVDEQLSSSNIERIRILQKILLSVVSIIYSFMGLPSIGHDESPLVDSGKDMCSPDIALEVPSSVVKEAVAETRSLWQQKAIILVMEAGGVNWLVELLRVIRRLNLREQWTDLSLHYLTLGTLRTALSQNPRAQNHFRSIGGLEVLLDGLGLPSSKWSISKNPLLKGDDRNGSHLFGIFQLQILSLEVLRESVYP